MSYQIKLEAAAAQEVELAFEWYETRRSGLGVDFLRAVATAQDMLAREPEQFPLTKAPFRWIKLRRFPYGLHYRIKERTVLVVGCLHFRQSPLRWPGA